MAKIQDLAVDTIKIKNGAITEWFFPVAGVVTVTNSSNNPTFFWLGTDNYGRFKRNSDDFTIARLDGYERVLAFDDDPPSTVESYSWEGTTYVGVCYGAKVRKK